MKKILLTCSILTCCMAFVSCGNNDNSYSSDGEMLTTEYVSPTTERKRNDDRDNNDRHDDDRYYDDEHYDTDGDGNVDTRGSSNSVKDHADDAIDGVENAGEDIVDGVGDAAGEIIDGAGDAVGDVVDGLDGETTTNDNNDNQ